MSARRSRASHRVASPVSRPRRGAPARHSPSAVELLSAGYDAGYDDRNRPARHLRVPAAAKHARLPIGVVLPPVTKVRGVESASPEASAAATVPTAATAATAAATRTAPDRPAARTRRAEKRASRSSMPRLLAMLAVALCIAVGMRTFALQMFFIPSASMEPTLCGGAECADGNDRILVNKLSYRLHAVDRGDVVVFARPAALNGVTTDSNLVKRVVAVAGDSVRWDRADLYINNVKQHESYVDPACNANPSQWVGSTVVPAGDVFVMGDNRCDSEDSRIFGPIETKSIVGKAFIIVWPVGRIHPL